MDPHGVLVHHMADVQKAFAEFREASERRHDTSSQTKRVSKILIQSFTCAEEAQHLQLEPRAQTRTIRCLRKACCRQVACHHLAGGI